MKRSDEGNDWPEEPLDQKGRRHSRLRMVLWILLAMVLFALVIGTLLP